MKSWLRRVRGAVGNGITWALGWAPIGALTGLATGWLLGAPAGIVAGNFAGMFAVLGFLGGAVFSGVLRLAEGRRRFAELSLPRFVGWGALGGLLLGGAAAAIGLLGPGLSVVDAIMVGTTTLLGSASAAGSLALARRVDREALGRGGVDPRLREADTPRRLEGAG